MAEPTPPRFTVRLAPKQMATLREWSAWAESAGLLAEYLQALKTVNYRLGFEADEWGEPSGYLDHLGLEMREGAFLMLAVRYGVQHARRLVFVQSVRWRGDYAKGAPPAADEGTEGTSPGAPDAGPPASVPP